MRTGALLAAAIIVAGLVPSSAMTATDPGVDITIRTGGDRCPFKLGCRVGITVTPSDGGAAVLEGVLDRAAEPTTPEGMLAATLVPGTYIASVTALGVTEPAPAGEPPGAAATTVMGGCATTVELVAEQPEIKVTAAMAWHQPACGIAIAPQAPGVARPVLSKPIEEGKRTPRFRPHGAPTVSTTKNGIKVELWVKDPTLRRGQWLLAHLRVSNVSHRTIRHNGRFEDLDCPPISVRADTSDLFDPGRTWTGAAATYKKRFFRDGILLRTGLSIPKYARGNGCGDVGQAGRLKPGAVEDVPLAGLPRYGLRKQPLPPGAIHISAGFEGSRSTDRVSVSTDVTLAGGPVDYPSPGQLVDAALSTPGFVETLERQPDPRDWANAHVATWLKRPYPRQPRLAGARGAPEGILEIGQFFSGSDVDTPFVVGAVIDPWTAESYGAYAWPGWSEPRSAL